MAEEESDDTSENNSESSEDQTNADDRIRLANDAAVQGVDINIVAILGTAELKISQILQLGRGAVVELDRLVGEPVDICAERQLVAKGEVVVVEDRLAIQLTEVVNSDQVM